MTPYLQMVMDDFKGYTVGSARRELIRAFVRTDDIICKKGNIYYGGKTFVLNSIISWCLEQRAKKFFSLTDMRYYVTLIQRYIDDEIDLWWDGKTLNIQSKK